MHLPGQDRYGLVENLRYRLESRGLIVEVHESVREPAVRVATRDGLPDRFHDRPKVFVLRSDLDRRLMQRTKQAPPVWVAAAITDAIVAPIPGSSVVEKVGGPFCDRDILFAGGSGVPLQGRVLRRELPYDYRNIFRT